MQRQKLYSCQSCYGSTTRYHFGSRDPRISVSCWNSDHDDKPIVQSWTFLVSGSQVVPPGACQQGWGPCCPRDIRVWGFNVSVNTGGRLSQVRWAKSPCATHAWRGRARPGTRFFIILKWWHCGKNYDDYNDDGNGNDEISWIWRGCWPCEAIGASLSAS